MSDQQGTGGYVRLYRKLLENPIWTQLAPAVAKVAVYFLLKAGWRSKPWYDGSETIDLPAGSFVTSLTSTAKACHISAQQTRDAFSHLKRTQFATYRGTHRYTVVTVLNWASYQSSPDEENTAENTEENSKRTLNKKTRSNKHTPPTPSQEGAVTGFLLDPDQLPFATRLIPFPTETNRRELDPLLVEANTNHHSAGRNGNGRGGSVAKAIQGTAERIHARHPKERRDMCVERIAKTLVAILKHRHVPGHEQAAFLDRLDRTHAAMCASEGWQKDGGQYAKALENWLAPTKERYLVEPPSSATEPPRMIL